jgi:hypothetical protein
MTKKLIAALLAVCLLLFGCSSADSTASAAPALSEGAALVPGSPEARAARAQGMGTGAGRQGAGSANPTGEIPANAAGINAAPGNAAQSAGTPAAGTQPVRVVTGKVTAIVGNLVTLAIESEKRPGTEPVSASVGGAPQSSAPTQPTASSTPEQPAASSSLEQNTASSQSTPTGADAESSTAEKPSVAVNPDTAAHDPETDELLLPVGMTIGKGDFSSVTVGMKLRILFGIHPTLNTEIITAVIVVT